MPLNKLDSIIKNTEGRILYVSPSDLDSTDSISNQGNSLARPFKTLQRALLESARFSYVKGNSNDEVEKTTILLMPGEHVVDNRPGVGISDINSLSLTLDSNFDLTQSANDLYKYNSVNGGVIVPRGTSIVGLDLRKTKVRPLYVPNPTDDNVENSAIFRITGACYFWQFSVFDGDEFGTVYTQPNSTVVTSPSFSHHKLTVFEYADGVNEVGSTGLTDLETYYAKLSRAYGSGSGREVDSDDRYPSNPLGFTSRRPEYEIVGAFASDPINIATIKSGDGIVPSRTITVTTVEPHGLNIGTPIRITNVNQTGFDISTRVTDIDVDDDNTFFYTVSEDPALIPSGVFTTGQVTVETDTVSGASPYIFNISMRSVWGMNGMHADGSKATGFRSMVVAQFTGVSLQKDDRAFVKYNASSRIYENTFYSAGTFQSGSTLSKNSSSTGTPYHLDSDVIYRKGWEQTHIKITNDAIVQIVSVFAIGYNKHFAAESGGDASVTNSNSNFGQLSLIADGFKKEAFGKDDKAFITHIIPPRTIESTEEDIDWLTIDQGASNTTTKLFLFGFTSENIKPPTLTQGFRVGAKVGDKLYLGSDSADIVMPSGASSFEEYSVGSPVTNTFTVSGGGTHNLTTGEKVIIISDDGDLPENLRTNNVYYAIASNNTTIKLAASESEATSESAINVSGGTNLKIITRVSDKVAGDLGHPVQWDSSAGQWYINVSAIGNTIGVVSGSGATEPTVIKRIADTRSLDEKIYKIRVVVPSQLGNAKSPEPGFILQESSTTGYVSAADTSRSSIDSSNYDWNRNPRFISNCSFSSPTVTITTEIPHNLQTGDSVIIKNVTDSSNTDGLIDKGYNGTYDVTVVDDITFTYTTTLTPGASFTNDVHNRSTSSPRFERNDFKSNLYIYRNEVISEYSDGDSNGVYHIYALNSNNAIQNEFTNLKYSQNVTNLYPQLDRDNINDNPTSAKTYALRSPIGEVQTSDLKKSITRESADLLLKTLGTGLKISSVTNPTSTSPTIVFDRNHSFGGIVVGSVAGSTTGFTPGTYYNVKIYNNSGLTQWNGATAKVVVQSGGNIGSVEIINKGSNYSDGTYYLDTGVIGTGNNSTFTVAASGISSPVGQVIQFTGVGTVSDTYHRISAVTGRNSVSIARTTGDPVITSDHYALNTAPSTAFTASGDTITATAHGLAVGNKFRSIDGSNNNVGDYIVDTVVDVNTFTVSGGVGAASGRILKHALSSNSGTSGKSDENLQERAFTLFDGETLTLIESGGINSTSTSFSVSGPNDGVIERFPLGTYIQVDDEIMRVSSNTLTGPSSNKITVIRGALATKATTHLENSLIKKIKVPAVEFRRPSIIRASGHTFEYLGYGPGNYSTALPQVQDKTLTEREEFLSQAQERSCGIVVYTGMNNKGDFFIGNQKKSSATGEEITFDTPIPTITGEDPSRLSAVFDEVIIKERLVVEGGDSGQVLSQFDGPVTFNGEIKSTDKVRITNQTNSTSPTSGALVVSGGIGIGSDLNVGGDLNVSNDLDVVGAVQLASGGGITTTGGDFYVGGDFSLSGQIIGNGNFNAGTGGFIGAGGTFGNIQIAISDDNTIDTVSGDLALNSANGVVVVSGNLDVNGTGTHTFAGDVEVDGEGRFIGDLIAFFSSDERLKDNIEVIEDPLSKVLSISGNTFDWNDNSNKEGRDTGVIAQEVESLGLPGIVTTRDNGYKAVRYEKLVPLLVEAIKELTNKVENLEQKLSDK
jgi:hypothetical protein